MGFFENLCFFSWFFFSKKKKKKKKKNGMGGMMKVPDGKMNASFTIFFSCFEMLVSLVIKRTVSAVEDSIILNMSSHFLSGKYVNGLNLAFPTVSNFISNRAASGWWSPDPRIFLWHIFNSEILKMISQHLRASEIYTV